MGIRINDTREKMINFYEEKLNPFAQKSNSSDRRQKVEVPDNPRTEFERDRDRILHSSAFRRLMHKTQIFTSGEDDYFRTRLTHTLEVMQISSQLARNLGVNSDLAEAIALGHDLGHTPFGHEGERLLNNLLSGEETLSKKIKYGKEHGGFRHNFQSLRLIDTLGETYSNEPGLNLTWQVREGILKHTDFQKDDGSLLCNYPQFDVTNLHTDKSFSVTIEGQIVAMADEIAQRAHDLDDGLASRLINLDDIYDQYDYAKIIFGNKSLYESDNAYIVRQKLVSAVLKYFIKNLRKIAVDNIKKYWSDKDNQVIFKVKRSINQNLIQLKKSDLEAFKELKEFIQSRVINSHHVNVADGKAVYILKHIIKAYIANPRQINHKVLQKCYKRISESNVKAVNLLKGSRDEVKREIRYYQGTSDTDSDSEKREANIKHKIFIRAIADHVAGMTDNFANDEFRKLYVPK